MNVFVLILFFMKVESVIMDEQCDCNTLVFLKQIVQQEIFERKLEFSKLQSDVKKISGGHGLFKINSMTGLADRTRIDRLEQRFAEFEDITDIRQQTNAENLGKGGKSHNYDNIENYLTFEKVVKHALRQEKKERMNLISQVKRQMDNLNGIVSTIVGDMKVLEQSASKNLKTLRRNAATNLEENKQIQTVLNGINSSLTNIGEDVNECISATDLLKSDVGEIRTHVNNFEETVTQLHHQFGEHLNVSERWFSVVAEKVGKCRGDDWIYHGNKCYRFSNYSMRWVAASEKCRELDSDLVKIESKEENDYIVAAITKRSSASKVWIGLNDRENENSWRWNSGSSTLGSIDFTNWAPGEPNDKNENEDCTQILSSNGQWSDYCCLGWHRFICQKDPEL